MDLRIYNERVFNQYIKLGYEKMSCPLLVSSKKEYVDNLRSPILYIGQETYTWLNHEEDFLYTVDSIEEGYYRFFKELPFSMNVFWNFFKESTGIPKQDFINRLIWGNCYICGKKTEKGLTEYYNDIKELSIEYLIRLYENMKPELTIFACGNKEAYYSVVQEFVKRTKDYHIDRVSKQNELIVLDDIVYTYHPNNLRFSSHQKEIKEKIKSLV